MQFVLRDLLVLVANRRTSSLSYTHRGSCYPAFGRIAPEDDNLIALGVEALHDLVDLLVEGLPVISVPRILQAGFVNSQRAILSTT